MKISLTVNGSPVEADVAPRTSLADFLREDLLLTGTHLGCEHGICGACTVEIDGQISRSCITYAVACSGANVCTIEGFDADPTMGRLRDAFRQHHALQCGYCTPGMLIAARDLVRRKQGLTRAQIRTEMSGNLCRCTGYMGIISAVEHVMRHEQAAPQPAPARSWLGPAPGPQAISARTPMTTAVRNDTATTSAHQALPTHTSRSAARGSRVRVVQGHATETGGSVRLTQHFVLPHARDAVWAVMADTAQVARCMPGVTLDGPPDAEGRVTGRINVKIGPITAAFAGEAQVTEFPAERRQLIEGRGGDRKSGSRVTGSVDYRLTALPASEPETAASAPQSSEATRVDVEIAYALTGMLAQLGRSTLAQDFARRLGEAFAQNIDALLSDPAGAALPQAPLSGFSLLLQTFAGRLRELYGRLLGRSG